MLIKEKERKEPVGTLAASPRPQGRPAFPGQETSTHGTPRLPVTTTPPPPRAGQCGRADDARTHTPPSRRCGCCLLLRQVPGGLSQSSGFPVMIRAVTRELYKNGSAPLYSILCLRNESSLGGDVCDTTVRKELWLRWGSVL